MKNKKNLEIIQLISIILLILFGFFILYQIIRKIAGGSWSTENIIVSLLIFNIGLSFTVAIGLAKINSDHEYLSNQFKHLASDFKNHTNKL